MQIPLSLMVGSRTGIIQTESFHLVRSETPGACAGHRDCGVRVSCGVMCTQSLLPGRKHGAISQPSLPMQNEDIVIYERYRVDHKTGEDVGTDMTISFPSV